MCVINRSVRLFISKLKFKFIFKVKQQILRKDEKGKKEFEDEINEKKFKYYCDNVNALFNSIFDGTTVG